LTANALAYASERPPVGERRPHLLRRDGAIHFFLTLPLFGGVFLSRFVITFFNR